MSEVIELNSIEQAIDRLQQGRMIILVDDASRENEGDMVVCGQLIDQADLQFMWQHGSGIVCLAMTAEDCFRLGIQPMAAENHSAQKTPFGVSFEAAQGISTGVSVKDRLRSIQVASHPQSTRVDLVSPGHVFPLCANDGGVMARAGHTEGSVELMKAAGLPTSAVICEMMNTDGSMARLPDIMALSLQFDIPVVSVNDLIRYRTLHESWVVPSKTVPIATKAYGELQLTVFFDKVHQQEYSVITQSPYGSTPLVRIHSQCFTGDVLGSLRCDCGEQLHLSLQKIAQQGGVCIYTPQEGRGIGLMQKMQSYALQDEGYDTVEAISNGSRDTT